MEEKEEKKVIFLEVRRIAVKLIFGPSLSEDDIKEFTEIVKEIFKKSLPKAEIHEKIHLGKKEEYKSYFKISVHKGNSDPDIYAFEKDEQIVYIKKSAMAKLLIYMLGDLCR